MAPSADFYEAFVEALVAESTEGIPVDHRRAAITSAAAFARDQVGSLTADLRWPLIAGLTRQARAALMQYSWPGNVRELENAIERAVVMGENEWIDVSDLPESIVESAADAEAGYHALVNQAKRDTIRRALERAGGNVAQAARDLHLQPTYLHRLVRHLGLRDAD